MPNEMKRIRFGSHEFDPATGELFRDGQIVKLQPQPSRVLSLLLSQPGEVVSREQLREALWPDGTTVEFDQGLNFCVRQIRSALGESASNPEFVETLPKKGYRFIATIDPPVEAAPLPPPPTAQVPSRLRWPLLAGALGLLSLLIGWTWYGNRTATLPKSILIQAFVPLGMGEEDAWYGDAIAQQLIGHLAKAKGIRVLPWSATTSFRERKLSGVEAARTEGADAILEGSVRKQDNRLIVTAQLVDTSSERVIWSYRDDRAARDLGEIENAVTASMARALRFRIVEGEQPLARRRPEDPETYNLYLKGMALNDRLTSVASAAAEEAFAEVMRRAPNFAPAYVGMANLLVLETFTRGASKSENFARALELAESALKLDPDFAEAHGARAHALFNSWNWAEADREFQTALRLDPESPTILQLYGIYLATQRRFDEAMKALKRAEDLSPVSGLIATSQCRVAFYAKRYDDAIAACKRALVIDPARRETNTFLGRTYVMQGKPQEAQRLFTESGRAKRTSAETLWNAYFEAARGDQAAARLAIRTWEELPKKGTNIPLPYALTKLQLREGQAGFAALRQIVGTHSTAALWLRVTPELDPYRSDPGFQKILAPLGSD